MTMVNIHICNLCLKMVIDSEAPVSDTISQNKIDSPGVERHSLLSTVLHSCTHMCMYTYTPGHTDTFRLLKMLMYVHFS